MTEQTGPLHRSRVVRLTDHNGCQALSSSSILTEEEAAGEAASWRHTDVPASSKPWQAGVCLVVTPAEMEEAARAMAAEVIAKWDAA